jgi:hypothetical protein
VNLDPTYVMDSNGWGPRLGLDYQACKRLALRAGTSITTILPNLYQDDMATAGTPFIARSICGYYLAIQSSNGLYACGAGDLCHPAFDRSPAQ